MDATCCGALIRAESSPKGAAQAHGRPAARRFVTRARRSREDVHGTMKVSGPIVAAPVPGHALARLCFPHNFRPKEFTEMKRIETANAETLTRMLTGDPVLIDVIPAHEAIPALEPGMILHAGPPIDWERMCGPMRGAIAGAAVFEGWADDLDSAADMAAAGAFEFHPNQSFASRLSLFLALVATFLPTPRLVRGVSKFLLPIHHLQL